MKMSLKEVIDLLEEAKKYQHNCHNISKCALIAYKDNEEDRESFYILYKNTNHYFLDDLANEYLNKKYHGESFDLLSQKTTKPTILAKQ